MAKEKKRERGGGGELTKLRAFYPLLSRVSLVPVKFRQNSTS